MSTAGADLPRAASHVPRGAWQTLVHNHAVFLWYHILMRVQLVGESYHANLTEMTTLYAGLW